MSLLRFTVLCFATCLTVGLALADDKEREPQSGNSINVAAVELVEVLRGAVIARKPPPTFELVGRNDTIVEFDSVIESSEVIDFRLQLDRQNELLRWAMKQKKETFFSSVNGKVRTDDELPGQLTYAGVSIQGENLTSVTALRARSSKARFESFDKAMAAARIPTPAYFGLVSYRLFRDGEKELKRLESLIMDPETTVRVRPLPEGVRYVARNRVSEKRFTVYTWEFSLPNYLPQSLTVDQSTTGKATRIRSQRVFWETSSRGHRRPFRIAAETPIVKRKPEGGYEIGRKSVDLELVWLEPEQINKMAFVSLIDIQKYLDIGAAIAKQRNLNPSKPD